MAFRNVAEEVWLVENCSEGAVVSRYGTGFRLLKHRTMKFNSEKEARQLLAEAKDRGVPAKLWRAIRLPYEEVA